MTEVCFTMTPMTTLSARLRRGWLDLILAGVVTVLILNCFIAPRGAGDLVVLRRHRMALEAQLRRLSAENAGLETRVQNLRSDGRYLERLVRSELGFVRSDEIVYRFGGDGANQDR